MPMLFARDKSRALFEAIQKNRPDHVKQLLGKGVDVNSRDESGATPLMKALYAGSYRVVKELLEVETQFERPR